MLSTPTTENAVDPREVKQWIKKQLASSLRTLQIRYVTSDDMVTSEDSDANTLCCVLEAVFIHGLKEKHIKVDTGSRGKKPRWHCSLPQPAFWTLLKTITHRDVIKELEGLSFVNTDVGRCRAWIRLALNESLVESYLVSLLRERSKLTDYYHHTALLLDAEEVGVILSYVQGLMALSFMLSYKSAILNEWTLSPLSLAGLCPSPDLQMEPLIPSAPQALRKQSWDSMSQSSGSEETDANHPALLHESRTRRISKCGSSTLSLDTNGSSQFSSSFGSDGPALRTEAKSPDKSEELLSCDSDLATGHTEESDGSLQDSHNEIRKACRTASSDPIPNSQLEVNERPASSTAKYSQRFRTISCLKSSESSALARSTSKAQPTGPPAVVAKKDSAPPNGTGLQSSKRRSSKRTEEAKDPLPGSERICKVNDPEKGGGQDSSAEKCCTSPTATLPKSTSWITEDDFHVPPSKGKKPETQPPGSSIAHAVNGHSVPSSDARPPRAKAFKPPAGQESKSFSVVHRRQMGLTNPFRGLLMLGHLERRGVMGLWKEFFCELSPFELRLLLNQEDRTCFENCSLLRCESVGEVHSEGRFYLLFSDKKLYLRAPSPNEAQDWVDRLREALQKCRPQREEPWEVLQVPEPTESMDCPMPSFFTSTGKTPEVVFDWTLPTATEPESIKESVLYMKEGTVWHSFIFSLSVDTLRSFKMEDHDKQLCSSHGMESIRDVLPDTSMGGPNCFRVITHRSTMKLKAESAEEAKSWREMIRCALQSYMETVEETLMNALGLDGTSRNALTYSAKERRLLQCLTAIPTEKGLDSQNFKCAGCPRQIGFSFGRSKLCAFSGLYYCDTCHRDDDSVIPSRIIHNWDLSKRTICRPALKFLNQIRNEPLINVKTVNESLYVHVEEMSRISKSREQLKLLGEYLFTCRSGALQELSKQVDHRNYLLEAPQQYSVTDLQQICEGMFEIFLQSLIQFASEHIYNCDLCSQRGFICQICNRDDIIFPFEFDTTARCLDCKTVFHSFCKIGVDSCPRCVRRRKYYESKKAVKR